LNPHRRIVEQYDRISVKSLFWAASGIPGQPTTFNDTPIPITVFMTPDNNGIIQVGTQQWPVQYIPKKRWPNWEEYCVDYFLVGRDGKRARYLLIAPDGSHAGTISELGAHYRSSHKFSPNRVLKRRREIVRELLLNSDAADLTLHYIEMPPKPYNQMRPGRWRREVQARYGHGVVLVDKPWGMQKKKFMKMLAYLNRPHKPKGKGTETLREMDRLFAPGPRLT
jgi:hypothetical protein